MKGAVNLPHARISQRVLEELPANRLFQFQVILPCGSGHVSVGVEADGGPLAIAESVAARLSASEEVPPIHRASP